jgi:FSR family fosmidomycin resistance protein-like MFS transporter
MPPDKLKPNFMYQWGGKTALFFTYLHGSHDLTTGLLVALLPFIRQDLGINYLQAGLLTSAFSLTAGISQLFGGWISDRIPRKTAMAVGLFGVGLCSLGIGFAPNYYFLLGILILQGIMAGWYHPSALASISGYFEQARRGKAISVHMLGGTLGFLIGPTLGAGISTWINWHYAFVIISLPTIIAGILALTILKMPTVAETNTDVKSPAGKPPKKFSDIINVFRSMLGIYIIVLLVQLLIGPGMSFVSLFLVDQHHMSTAAAAIWVSIIRAGSVIGSLLGGWMSDKYGRQRAILVSLVFLGITVYLLAHLPLNVGLAIVFVFYGMLMSMRETTMQAYLMDSSPAHLRATTFGIYFGFGQEGSSLIQPGIGRAMDVIGIGSVFNIIGYIGIGLSLISIVVGRKYFRRQNK